MLTDANLTLGVRNYLETAYEIPCFIRGVPFKQDTLEEWITVNPLAVYRFPSRQSDIRTRFWVEILCYSVHASKRKDRNFQRVWELGQLYMDLLHQKRMTIESSCIQFLEPRSIFLDLRSIGDFAKNLDQSSPDLELQCMQVQCEAYIYQPKPKD